MIRKSGFQELIPTMKGTSALLDLFPELKEVKIDNFANEDYNEPGFSSQLLTICYLTVRCWFGLSKECKEFNVFINIIKEQRCYRCFAQVVECFRKFSVYEINADAFQQLSDLMMIVLT